MEPYHGEEGLATLLARQDVDAVLAVIPPQGMIEVRVVAGWNPGIVNSLLATRQVLQYTLQSCPHLCPSGSNTANPSVLQTIKACLAAGKHVLSEKPAGPTFTEVQELLRWHSQLPEAPLWCVEENFRQGAPATTLRDPRPVCMACSDPPVSRLRWTRCVMH